MYDFFETVSGRASYRGDYTHAAVPREHLVKIMEAGLAAPSGCNKQTTSLICVDDPALLDELKALMEPPICQTAPAIICVLTQRIIAYADRCFSTHDYSAAVENMLLAIKALGYDSCWYEGYITDEKRIGEKLACRLGVPEGYELVCVLPVGVAAASVKPAPKKPFGERAWFNGFGNGE